jgi:hypothetical protein
MKLKAIRSFRLGTTTFGRGVAVDVSDPVAKDLIKRGFASEDGVAPPPEPQPAREVKPKPARSGNQRRDSEPATTGRAADRKED